MNQNSTSENLSEDSVLLELKGAGYGLVIREEFLSRYECDLIAYSVDSSGSTMGTAVEIKTGRQINYPLVAARLSAACAKTGAKRGLLRTPDGYFELNPSGDGFVALSGLEKVNPGHPIVHDPKIVASLMWDSANELRQSAPGASLIEAILDQVEITPEAVIWKARQVPIDPGAFRDALSRVANRHAGKTGGDAFSSSEIQSVFSSITQLLAPSQSIFDPFFGLGFTSFAALESLISGPERNQGPFKLLGFEAHVQTLTDATRIAETLGPGVEVKLQQGSCEDEPWPSVDLLLTEPPLALRLANPRLIEGVALKTLEEFALMKSAVGILNGTIRNDAVILTSRGWLSRRDTAGLRAKLAEMKVVKALVGLPNLKTNASIDLLLVVLRRNSAEAVVGELKEDWRQQLSLTNGGPGGLLA